MLIYPTLQLCTQMYRMNPPVHLLETQEGIFFRDRIKSISILRTAVFSCGELAHPSLRQWFSARKGCTAHSNLGIVSAPKWRSSSMFGSPSKVRKSRADRLAQCLCGSTLLPSTPSLRWCRTSARWRRSRINTAPDQRVS